LKDALLIPQRATFEVMDQRYVFVIDKDNVARMTRVKVGAELPHLFVIEEGLAENDRVLLDGIRKVKNNEEIEVNFVEPDSVLNHLEIYAE
jgi:membrane fusion protein (multidrug efflux system)